MKISIVGSGNVAWHFSRMWRNMGFSIHEICARNQNSGAELAKISGAHLVHDPGKMDPGVDFVFIAVKDDAIHLISQQLPLSALTIHSSGATSIDVLVQLKKAVIWGVQSYRKEKDIDYLNIPFCIETSDASLNPLIESILPSGKIYQTNSEQRLRAHLAIVFGNNFVTQLYSIAEEILNENNLPIDLLLPSITEMTEGLQHNKPDALQTGPAYRNDIQTLKRHLAYLSDIPELETIYKVISNRILTKYHGKKL